MALPKNSAKESGVRDVDGGAEVWGGERKRPLAPYGRGLYLLVKVALKQSSFESTPTQ
jgi:hypothetical protein